MKRHWEVWVASLLLLLSFALQVKSIPGKSPTYDEQGYIARGYAFVKEGDTHIRIGTPMLLSALNALPLLSLPDVRLPLDHPAWQGTDFHSISRLFLWEINDNPDQIVFLARLPTIGLNLLLAVLCFRWARELFGTWGGLLTLLLCALDPNLIAHGRLAATDLGYTALAFIATYWLWRLLRRPTWTHLLATGAFFALAQAAKFSALLLGPIFALLFAIRAFIRRSFVFPRFLHRFLGASRVQQPWWGRLGALVIAGGMVLAVATLTLWAVYGFEVGPIEGLTRWPVPAPSHVEQFLDLSGRLRGEAGREVTAFLMSDLYAGGRWQYFPVAFALKTPLPTLLALAFAALLSIRRPIGSDAWCLWLPPAVFFASSLTSNLNLGYRYILPVLPYALVLAGRTGEWLAEGVARAHGEGRKVQRAVLVAVALLLAGWTVWNVLWIYPHYLAYFNELAGGPDNGWRYLVDSNIDWGQDLPGLKRWMDENGVERIKLGYVGEAYPAHYGIAFDPLPSFPDRWQHPMYHDLYDADPAPGVYAISANMIQGRNLPDPETYAWFREREPIDKVGYSIFLYDVPQHGEGGAVLGLSGIVPADIRPEDYAALGTNDVRVLWFDVERALIAPQADDGTLLLVAGGKAAHPALAHLWPWEAGEPLSMRDGRPLEAYEGDLRSAFGSHVTALAPHAPVWHQTAAHFAPGDPANHGERLAYPVQFGDTLELLAYDVDRGTMRPGDTLTLVTYWRVRAPAQGPLRLFVHLLDENSAYRGGEDRLDVWHDNWLPGDQFAQVQEVPLDAGAALAEHQVEIGWYDPTTMQRLPVVRDGTVIADRVLLQPVRVE